ncbi:low molecular weight protein arginine phosphatase [Paenibacillus sp. P13VS]|uniref:low molecular weight protein arginine phosphatase n=1 Tax=Paenibacillus sp. P13VS TaxID=2697367 RepID=UPI00187BAC92|nr:low molecular weight protein arginine phosphatase [Paenibacillus sp. P13VS]MBE7681685.1 low molecular weight protein arginine phosphatase [Paenibacillus sp. P13VS]
MKHILFVCTGNTCRSPMAEGLLRKLAAERGIQVEVRSAGVAAASGMPISRHAEAVLRDHQAEGPGQSTQLDASLIGWADLVLTLTRSHKQHVMQVFPDSVHKTYTLKEYVENDDQVLNDLQELDSLFATLELKRALGQEILASERERVIEIRQRIPSFDISDPFGGSRDDYNIAAAEIRTALDRLLDKLG